jgi:general secretion pathway protein B
LPTTQPSQPGSTVTADATRSAPPINPTEVGTATTTPPQASSPSIPVREQSGGAMPHRRSSGAQGAQPLAAAASASRAAPTLPTLLELPEELRRQLPTLQITGAVYSANAAQRLLLVNGQVLPEGSKLSPELVIDEIGPHSALLSFQGRRFQAAY